MVGGDEHTGSATGHICIVYPEAVLDPESPYAIIEVAYTSAMPLSWAKLDFDDGSLFDIV